MNSTLSKVIIPKKLYKHSDDELIGYILRRCSEVNDLGYTYEDARMILKYAEEYFDRVREGD